MSDVPYFLLHRDPDHRDEREQRRDQYALRGRWDRLPRHYLTIEDALEQANEVARLVLPEGEE